MNARVALVEPDPVSARELERLLAGEGWGVDAYDSLGGFLDSLLRENPEALLMDMHMPGMEGREMLRALRANPRTRRMILVGISGLPATQGEAAEAFSAGADEFFFKPLDPELLVVRLRSLLRRSAGPSPEACLRCGAVEVYPDSRVCRVDGREGRLTRLEFDILLHFLRNPRRVLTRGYLIGALWRGNAARGARAVDRHIHSLRVKLGPHGRLIETLIRVGYRLAVDAGPGRPPQAEA